jgi:hypothetical protein
MLRRTESAYYNHMQNVLYQSHFGHSLLKILTHTWWHLDPLLGNDSETGTMQQLLLSNGSEKDHREPRRIRTSAVEKPLTSND